MTTPRVSNRVAWSRHWESVYGSKPVNQLSWFTADGFPTLDLILKAFPERSTRIADIGCGASRLIDTLLDAGYRQLTAVDVSQAALDIVGSRLADRAEFVRLIRADATELQLPPGETDLWHDRAVYHFLTEVQERQRYRDRLLSALAPEGAAIISGFAINGPTSCSGLPVRQLSSDRLQTDFPGLRVGEIVENEHMTPSGNTQRFLTALLHRSD
jgi:SAM-dependent methyltransferase